MYSKYRCELSTSITCVFWPMFNLNYSFISIWCHFKIYLRLLDNYHKAKDRSNFHSDILVLF